jgi:hypothetical protein
MKFCRVSILMRAPLEYKLNISACLSLPLKGTHNAWNHMSAWPPSQTHKWDGRNENHSLKIISFSNSQLVFYLRAYALSFWSDGLRAKTGMSIGLKKGQNSAPIRALSGSANRASSPGSFHISICCLMYEPRFMATSRSPFERLFNPQIEPRVQGAFRYRFAVWYVDRCKIGLQTSKSCLFAVWWFHG